MSKIVPQKTIVGRRDLREDGPGRRDAMQVKHRSR